MLTLIPDEQLSEAVFNAVEDGAYPAEEAIVSAELPSSAFDNLLGLLDHARAEVKTSIRELSKLSAPDIDGWVSQARQLRVDIDDSQRLSEEIVALAAQGKDLQAKADDAAGKVELLRGEVVFNKALAGTLQQVYDLRYTLDTTQAAVLKNTLPEAIALVKKADRELSELRGCENTRLADLVRDKIADLRKVISETLIDQWNKLVHVNTEDSTVSLRRGTILEIDNVVSGLSALGLLKGRILLFRKAFDNVIVTPRLRPKGDGTTASWAIDGDDIRISGRTSDTSTEMLFADIQSMISYLSSHLPSSVAIPLSEVLLPGLTSRLVTGPLSSSVPPDLDRIPAFKVTLDQVLRFAGFLDLHGYQGKTNLTQWADEAPRVWLTRRSEVALSTIRQLLIRGLGDPRTVERVETQVITRNDNMFMDGGNNDDWNADWSDEEVETKQPKPSSGVASRNNGQSRGANAVEEDVSAWGLDDEEDNHGTDMLKDKDKDEDEGDAWGWGDENDGHNDSKSPQPPPSVNPAPERNGDIPSEAPAERQVTLRETYTITAIPEQILEIIVEVVSDAMILSQSHSPPNPVAPAADGLFALPGLLLSMYRACAPNFYQKNISGNMFLYNDGLYMAEKLRSFAEHQARHSENLEIEADTSALELFGKRAYGKEMESQRTVLGDLLDGAQGFANCTEHPFAQGCDLAVSSTVDRLREVHRQWKPVLSRSALLQSIGSLLSTVINKIILDIEDMSDISEPESQHLTSFCERISALEDLFLPDQPAELDIQAEAPMPRTAVYTPHWLKFRYLANILESSLVDIKYLWTEAELSLEFSADEVIDLIEALFADSEHRRRAIGEIRRSDKGR